MTYIRTSHWPARVNPAGPRCIYAHTYIYTYTRRPFYTRSGMRAIFRVNPTYIPINRSPARAAAPQTVGPRYIYTHTYIYTYTQRFFSSSFSFTLRYASYLNVSRDLYSNQSLAGSRRSTANCGTKIYIYTYIHTYLHPTPFFFFFFTRSGMRATSTSRVTYIRTSLWPDPAAAPGPRYIYIQLAFLTTPFFCSVRYAGYLDVSRDLYSNQSLAGSRRSTANCGTKAADLRDRVNPTFGAAGAKSEGGGPRSVAVIPPP